MECAAKPVDLSKIDVFYATVSDFKIQLLYRVWKVTPKILENKEPKILKEIQELYDKTKSKVDKLFQDIKSDLESKYQCQSSKLALDLKNIKNLTENLNSALDDINALRGSIIDTKVFLEI